MAAASAVAEGGVRLTGLDEDLHTGGCVLVCLWCVSVDMW